MKRSRRAPRLSSWDAQWFVLEGNFKDGPFKTIAEANQALMELLQRRKAEQRRRMVQSHRRTIRRRLGRKRAALHHLAMSQGANQ